MKSRRIVSLPQSILVSGCLAGSLLPVGALGSKLDLWEFTTGFAIVATGVMLSTVCVFLVVIDLFRHGKIAFYNQARVHVGFTFSLFVLSFFVFQFYLAISHPPVNDVTTDPLDPPRFEVARSPESFENVRTFLGEHSYNGSSKVQSFRSRLSPPDAFDVALEIVNDRDWKIHLSSRDKGFIEFTDTTFWFGFKDDGVIRIREDRMGSLVDMRSVSRVGKSDLGTNARRIRHFLEDFGELTKLN